MFFVSLSLFLPHSSLYSSFESTMSKARKTKTTLHGTNSLFSEEEMSVIVRAAVEGMTPASILKTFEFHGRTPKQVKDKINNLHVDIMKAHEFLETEKAEGHNSSPALLCSDSLYTCLILFLEPI